MSEQEKALQGLPPDLLRVLRDQSVIVPQDAAVFELIGEWAKPLPATASAEVDYEYGWAETAKRLVELREQLAAAEARATHYESALRTIRGPEDRGPWMLVYREVGGGYQGLQAIARATLDSPPDTERERGLMTHAERVAQLTEHLQRGPEATLDPHRNPQVIPRLIDLLARVMAQVERTERNFPYPVRDPEQPPKTHRGGVVVEDWKRYWYG